MAEYVLHTVLPAVAIMRHLDSRVYLSLVPQVITPVVVRL